MIFILQYKNKFASYVHKYPNSKRNQFPLHDPPPQNANIPRKIELRRRNKNPSLRTNPFLPLTKNKRKTKGIHSSKQLQKTVASVDTKIKHKLDKKPKPSGKHSPRKMKSKDQELEQLLLPEATVDQHR